MAIVRNSDLGYCHDFSNFIADRFVKPVDAGEGINYNRDQLLPLICSITVPTRWNCWPKKTLSIIQHVLRKESSALHLKQHLL